MPPPFVATLRVYEPLAAFSPADQRSWQEFIRAGRAVPAASAPAVERLAAWRVLGTGRSPRLESLPEAASVLEHGDSLLICPYHTRRRAAEAALEAGKGMPKSLADALVPPPVRASAERFLAAQAGVAGAGRRHVIVASWGPDIGWFVLVEPGERRVGGRPGARLVVYRVEMSKARRRAARALSVLRRSLGDLAAVVAMEDLARWLEEFHPRSMVELDYGPVADLLGEEGIEADTSARDVTEAIAALATGDDTKAGEAYQRVIDRWRAVRVAERLN